jgi:hypothetical protein
VVNESDPPDDFVDDPDDLDVNDDDAVVGGISPARPGSVAMDPDEAVPPGKVLELAAAGVRFVSASLKIEPDFTRDTLSLVDHYVEEARHVVAKRPEALALTANAIGAYLGEVVRRIHACWWRVDHGDPGAWRLEFRNVFLALYPVQIAHLALTRDEGNAEFGGFELPAPDRAALAARLAELPEVSEDEYYAPSTRVDVVDILVDALMAQRARDPRGARPFEPIDYERGGEHAPR